MGSCPDPVRPLDPSSPHVLARVLELNQQNAVELSDLDEEQLVALLAKSFDASVVGEGKAFLLSFDQGADYDSPNFQWFRSRYDRFVYVDRVAVSASARGLGLASQLYSQLFEAAAIAGHDVVCCDVNVDPPNPRSDAFHERHGFEEVGRAMLLSGKTVRYLARRL